MSQFDLYQELIVDHGTQPRNHVKMENPTHHAFGHNPVCGDTIELFLKIKDNTIIEASFQGSGCAISIASASMMSELLPQKATKQAKAFITEFQQMIQGKNDKDTPNSLVEDTKISALAGVRAYPMRVKCATLAWHALEHALSNNVSKDSTE